jgi:asparagine synthetase B (glutamine-hydrolysing)
VVFSGEIYNHIEVRNELQGMEMVFYCCFYTAVLVGAFKARGTVCFSLISGMWALDLFDFRQQ